MTDQSIPSPPASVSIVICCYNSAARLPQTLAHLAEQVVPDHVTWEVLVIDNASTDGTGDRALALWPQDAPAPLRVIPEPRPGVSFARLQGYRSAAHDVIAFVDDDNWVCPIWVARVSEIMTDHPQVGACGGAGSAVVEETAPAWFDRFSPAYAIGTQAPTTGVIPDRPGVLWGAGMSIRRTALDELYDAGFKHLLLSRKGGSLASGEDAELSFALRMAGWQLYFDPSLHYQHYMPANRLQWPYFMRLQTSLGEASVPLKHYELRLKPNWRKSPLSRLRDTWVGEMAICAVVLGGVAAKAALAGGRNQDTNSRLQFKQGKFREIVGKRGEFNAHRRDVQALYRALVARKGAAPS